MPFIPNHKSSCKPKRIFPTTCPECNESVIYIECTCRPRPSKFFLHLSGIRHERGKQVADIHAHLHECEGMRERMRQNREVRGDAKAIIEGYRRLGVSNPDILKNVEGPDFAHFADTYKVVMREIIAEVMIQELYNQGENYNSIYVRIQRDPHFSNLFKDVALRRVLPGTGKP